MTVGRPGTLRVGMDLCSVGDVRESLDRFGAAYRSRLFTEAELAYCEEAPELTAERLAARFAAKEAAMKVIGMGDVRPDWRGIEVVRRANGSCELRLTGTAAQLASDAGVDQLAVSLSHEGELAAAVVVATAKEAVAETPCTPEGER